MDVKRTQLPRGCEVCRVNAIIASICSEKSTPALSPTSARSILFSSTTTLTCLLCTPGDEGRLPKKLWINISSNLEANMHLLSTALPMLLLGVANGQTDGSSYLGCFSDPAENRVFEWGTSNSDMTAEACSALCSDSAFFGTQYSTECWCGDNVGYADNGAGVCDMACSGDSDEICGGSYALSIYSNDPSFLGCYVVPADNRDIIYRAAVQDDMTPEVCKELCPDYQYYALHYAEECWCSDTIDDISELDLDGICDMPCSGDASQICGGYYSMNIYENDVENDDDPAYLGCYSDPADNRVFVREAASDDMSAEVCLGHCSAYQYYGTQYSTECWCGDENADYDANGASDECDMPCAGDSGEMCGGFYSMSVYENFDVNTVDLSYRGCFSDPADSRVFFQSASSDAMTAELCRSQCDSGFYGTQYSTECWCGDINTPYSFNGEGVCDMTCSGNSEETCGGYYSMDVYAADPSYLGCFSNPADSSVFVLEASFDGMDADTCASLCADSAYYGTQYSNECWCGDNDDYAANGHNFCDHPCSGNPDEMCGSSSSLSVYQTI